MTSDSNAPPPLAGHGAALLPAVEVDSYNLEVRNNGGYLGDRASKRAFQGILDRLRKPLKKLGEDPFGDTPSDEIGKRNLDAAFAGESLDALGLMQGAVEEFAQGLAFVIRRFLKAKGWRKTERIVIGGGTRDTVYGEMAIARAGVILKGDGIRITLQPIRHHPDEAGLIGAAQLAPAWIFHGHDSILAVDIGGTNIRSGIVALNQKKMPDLSKASIWKREHWRHADDKPGRDEAIETLVAMLDKLIAAAGKEGLRLAPFIGIGCPGMIEPDGSIERGAQNLPGNWESSKFNLPQELLARIPRIGEHETAILMHNDAVVQGLSEVPFMRDVEHWGVLTIGTGLGNARFTNRPTADEDKDRKHKRTKDKNKNAKGGKNNSVKGKRAKDRA
jgi:hypothetical protein